MKYVIGTRGSKLALWQAEYVKGRMEEKYPKDEFELRIVKTKGDKIQDRPLGEIGGKGLFVREIEELLLRGEIHIGVHSMKDMPAKAAEGLMFTKAWKREDARDVLILREKKSLRELPEGAVIGTGSKRRKYQLLQLRPDLKIVDIRGNVDTRLKKMEEQKLDGIVLAAAGLKRLGMEEKITCYLEPEEMIPAPAQGILAIEVAKEALELQKMLDAFAEEETVAAAAAERGFLEQIGGDCHVPVGAFCSREAVSDQETEAAEKSLTAGGKKYRLRTVFGSEDGSRMAFAEVFGTEPEKLAEKAAKKIRSQIAGKVWLVGAGPGEPGLLTVKGLECIKKADCIIYDRLASPELLKYAKAGCELIYAGKQNHHHTLKQEEINRLLVEKAMEYSQVVRLKGGDVFVFGRGGEEGIYMAERGVSFEVVPGVTSAVAGLAYAGIPITHRGVAAGFHVVTAHSKDDELADLDFEAMAKSSDTCVFLMGLGKLGEIAQKLMEAGMPGTTKAAVVSHGTTPEQRVCTAPLSEIAAAVEKEGLTSPALIAVGEVVGLREQLNFYETKPAFGKHYLVPKIGEGVSGLTELLKEQGAAVTEVMTGKIERCRLSFEKEQLKKADWLIFTSRNGVESFFAALAEKGLDTRALAGSRIAIIGEKTAKALAEKGIRADLLPDSYHSDALIEALKKVLKKEDTVWYIRAEKVESRLAEELSGSCIWKELTGYKNTVADQEMPSEEELLSYDGIFFTCASSARRLLEGRDSRFLEKLCKKVNVYSIGPKCSESLKKYGVKEMIEAGQATYEALAEKIR